MSWGGIFATTDIFFIFQHYSPAAHNRGSSSFFSIFRGMSKPKQLQANSCVYKPVSATFRLMNNITGHSDLFSIKFLSYSEGMLDNSQHHKE
jgi:hypothetical protein